MSLFEQMKPYMIQHLISRFGKDFSPLRGILSSTPATLTLIGLMAFALPAFADGNEEEDIVQKDVMFSTPTDVTKRQKSTADEKGFSLLGAASLFTGRDNNVHHSPDSLSLSSRDQGNWFLLRSDKQFGKNVEMINSFTWKHRSYSPASTANLSRGYFSNWLDMRISPKLKLTLDLDIDGANDDATKITGVQFNRDYSYTRYSGDATFTWSPGGPHRLQFGGTFTRNNYAEVPQMVSFDWSWREGVVRYRYRFSANNYMKLSYAIAKKEYDDRPAYSLSDPESDTLGNPAQTDHFRDFRASWELPATKWIDAKLTFAHSSRSDLFESARSWTSNEWKLWLGMQPSTRLELSTQMAQATQNFENRRGDNGNLLDVKSWDIQTGARFTLSSSVRLFSSINYTSRNTNRNILPTYSYSSYLDYDGLSTAFGISFFFLTK